MTKGHCSFHFPFQQVMPLHLSLCKDQRFFSSLLSSSTFLFLTPTQSNRSTEYGTATQPLREACHPKQLCLERTCKAHGPTLSSSQPSPMIYSESFVCSTRSTTPKDEVQSLEVQTALCTKPTACCSSRCLPNAWGLEARLESVQVWLQSLSIVHVHELQLPFVGVLISPEYRLAPRVSH